MSGYHLFESQQYLFKTYGKTKICVIDMNDLFPVPRTLLYHIKANTISFASSNHCYDNDWRCFITEHIMPV